MTISRSDRSPSPAARIAGWAAGVACGAGFLWLVVVATGPTTGTAAIHVFGRDVVVSIADDSFEVGQGDHESIVVELPRGGHEVRLTRGGEVLERREVIVRPGKTIVLIVAAPAGAASAPPSGIGPGPAPPEDLAGPPFSGLARLAQEP